MAAVLVNFLETSETETELQQRFWKLEDPVYTDNAPSMIDKQVVELWNKQTVKERGHYTLPIPFKERPPQLPATYAVVKHQLDLLGNG